MKKLFLFFGLMSASFLGAADAAAMPTPNSCAALSSEMQTFAMGLAPANQAMFCGSFTDAERSSCMQMATQPGMSGDQAVEKMANDKGMMQNSAGGCPVH